jgi:hypothetical protein
VESHEREFESQLGVVVVADLVTATRLDDSLTKPAREVHVADVARCR